MTATKTRSQWVHRHPERGWEPCGKTKAESVCPFGESNHVALEEGVDAHAAAGRLNEHEYGDDKSIAKPKKKKKLAPNVVNGIDRSKVQYVDWDRIDKLTVLSSHEDMEAVGAEINAEVNRRLGYDPSELDKEELGEKLLEIQTTNREVMAEVVKTTGTKHEKMYGSLAESTNEAISVLPDGAKNLLSERHIFTKAVHPSNMQHVGQLSSGQVTIGSKPQISQIFETEFPANVPEGAIYTSQQAFELEEGYTISFYGNRKDTSEHVRELSDGTKVYHAPRIRVGQPMVTDKYGYSRRPAKRTPKGWKKISDTTEVWAFDTATKDDGIIAKKIVLDKPCYEVYEDKTVAGNILKAPKVDKLDYFSRAIHHSIRDAQLSVHLHEYTHAVQRQYRDEITEERTEKQREYSVAYRNARDNERVAIKEYGEDSPEAKKYDDEIRQIATEMHNSGLSQEEHLWDELKKDKIEGNFKGTTDTRFDGFPDSYMGDSSKKELWPVATENFFYTNASTRGNSLYGKKNADNPATERIRNWVVGQWVQAAQAGESKKSAE